MGAFERPDGAWLRTELDVLESRRPALHRALLAVWRHPAAVLVALVAVMLVLDDPAAHRRPARERPVVGAAQTS